jgi:hypothetical protein
MMRLVVSILWACAVMYWFFSQYEASQDMPISVVLVAVLPLSYFAYRSKFANRQASSSFGPWLLLIIGGGLVVLGALGLILKGTGLEVLTPALGLGVVACVLAIALIVFSSRAS